MILTLDVGNSQIHGGVFNLNGKLLFTFRKTSKTASSSDEYGLFLKSVLKENGFEPSEIKQISMCTVVPENMYSLTNACRKYFKISPFVLKAGTKTGLKINYRNPLEVGSDRIANAIAAIRKFPNKNLIVIDFGTATTFCAISKNQEYFGGVILAGLKISMQSLVERTSKLPSVEITSMKKALGRSTIESIQSGLFFSNLGAIKEICSRIKVECFKNQDAIVLATGGFARLYEKEKIFNSIDSALVLKGLFYALELNQLQKLKNNTLNEKENLYEL